MATKNQYIRADKLKERFLTMAQSGGPVMVHVLDICAAIDDELYETDADVAEVMHGRWGLLFKGQSTSVYACSACGRPQAVSGDEENREHHLRTWHPYCRCGAKMDGGVE